MHDGPVRHQGARDGLEKSYADRFSRLLREELEAAGHPTYQSIANRGGISKSAVSDARRPATERAHRLRHHDGHGPAR